MGGLFQLLGNKIVHRSHGVVQLQQILAAVSHEAGFAGAL
jgi:hypothetical protein